MISNEIAFWKKFVLYSAKNRTIDYGLFNHVIEKEIGDLSGKFIRDNPKDLRVIRYHEIKKEFNDLIDKLHIKIKVKSWNCREGYDGYQEEVDGKITWISKR